MRKNSPIMSCTDEEFKEIIKESKNFSDALRKFGFKRAHGGNYVTIKKRIKELNVDTSHFKSNSGKLKRFSNEEIFVKNSPYQGHVRIRIIRDNLIPYECAKCGNKGEWNNKPLTLTLDHINGDHNDNRLENLQFVCPNCDSQQDTYCYKNKHTYIGKRRPSKEELVNDILTLPLIKVGKKYNVSDNAVRKWLKKYKLPVKYKEIQEFKKQYNAP